MNRILDWIGTGRAVVVGAFAVVGATAAVLVALGVGATRPALAQDAPPAPSEFDVVIERHNDLEMDAPEFEDEPFAMHLPPGAAPGMDGGPTMHRMHGGGMGMGGMRMRGMRGGMALHLERLADELDLSDRQRDQIAELRDAQERKMIGIRSGIAEAGLDLRKAMRADAPSQAQIDGAIDRMTKLRGDAQKSRIATHLAMKNVLTDAQRKKLETMKKERHGKARAHKGQEKKKGA